MLPVPRYGKVRLKRFSSADRNRCRSANGTTIPTISPAAIFTSVSISGTLTGRDTRAAFFRCPLQKGTTGMADLITISQGVKPAVEFLEYTPQHPLMTIPADGEALELKEMKKAVSQLPDRTGDVFDEHSIYLELRLSSKKIKPDDRKEIEKLLETKDAVLCKLTQVMPDIDVTTNTTGVEFHSIDDILKRNPLDDVEECFVAKTGHSLSEEQRKTLEDYISTTLENDSNDEY